MSIRCKIIGHNPINIDTSESTAACSRCGALLEVGYEPMAFGGTVVIRDINSNWEKELFEELTKLELCVCHVQNDCPSHPNGDFGINKKEKI